MTSDRPGLHASPDPVALRRFREAVHRTIAGATGRGVLPVVAGRRLCLMLGRLPLVPRPGPPRQEPALRWLPQAERVARRGPLAGIMRHATPLLPDLPWVEEYAEEAITPDLRQKYAHADVAGREGFLASDGVRLGFVMLGPHAFYPAHSHPAEELYILLGGGAWWRRGEEPWRWQPAGQAIYHSSRMPHAMRTGPQPVLAVYAWWGRTDQPAGFLRRWTAARSPRARGFTKPRAGRPRRAG